MNKPFKWVLILLMSLVCLAPLSAQESRKVKQAKHKAQKRKVAQETQTSKSRNKKIKHHFDIQSDAVQDRMKTSEKSTRKHYSRRKFMNFTDGLFNKPRKKYGR